MDVWLDDVIVLLPVAPNKNAGCSWSEVENILYIALYIDSPANSQTYNCNHSVTCFKENKWHTYAFLQIKKFYMANTMPFE